MSPLLIALLGVLLLPLFIATWRTSLLGLACQGLLMAWIANRISAGPSTVNDWLTFADFIVVRGLGAPLELYAVLRSKGTLPRNDVIPPNLLSWTAALGIVLAAFNFAGLLVAESGDQQSLVAVATSGVLLGFLVLATQSSPFSQMVGALRIENAIALFELGGERHHASLGVHLGQIAITTATIAFYRWYLDTLLSDSPSTAAELTSRGPTL